MPLSALGVQPVFRRRHTKVLLECTTEVRGGREATCVSQCIDLPGGVQGVRQLFCTSLEAPPEYVKGNNFCFVVEKPMQVSR